MQGNATANEDPATLRDDAATFERAAEVIRRRTTKPDAIFTRALIRSLENSAASMRKRANET